MEPQKLLAALIQLSQEQQKTLGDLLNQIKRQTQNLSGAGQQAQRAASEIERAAQHASTQLQAAVREGIQLALLETLEAASRRAESVFDEASRPLLGKLAGAAQSAEVVEARLNRAARSFGWKWELMASGVAAVAVASIFIGAWSAVWWERSEVEHLRAEKAQMEERLEVLAKRGGKIELTDCGGRLCAYASTNQGNGYKDWKAPWSGRDGLPLVILRGY